MPSVSALEAVPGWESKCFNTTHIQKVANITDISDGSSILDAEMFVECNYGCDTQRNICHKWPGDAIPSEHFLLFQIVAFGLLFLVLFRIDTPTKEIKVFDLATSILVFILFATLGLQGYNVIDMSTGEAVPVNLVVAFDYGMSFFSLILFFFLLFKFVKSTIQIGDKF
jgi:hypothetical protein